jgi:hypothetical protein
MGERGYKVVVTVLHDMRRVETNSKGENRLAASLRVVGGEE